MGGCMSDIQGGQQAIGGGGGTNNPTTVMNYNSSTRGGGGDAAATSDAIDYFFRAQGFHPLFTNLQLSLSASKVRDRDILSKSDPMAVAYLRKKDGSLEEIGRTEVIMNALSPAWIVNIPIAYHFEIVQPLVFRVFDVDTKYHKLPTKSLKLKEQEFLGEASCVLSEIVTKRGKSLTLKLQRKDGHGVTMSHGSLSVHAEEAISSRQAFEMIFQCNQLKSKDLFSKSDPFLRISKVVEGGSMVPICKTEVVMNNSNPIWKSVCLTAQQIERKDNPLVIECFDFDSSGNHELMGQLQKSVADLEILYKEKSGANFFKPSSVKHGYMATTKGQLFVDGFCEKTLYSFLDYISSGFELNFMVAVDFTASNRNPKLPDSLHYIDPSGRFNAYQQAIFEVGEVIQFYDSDKHFPAWGFGGRTVEDGVSHCFNLNGSPSEPEVYGVDGIMSAYSRALHHVSLAGPTLFGQVINKAAEIASQSIPYNQRKYNVLLIITDGVLTDMQETKSALVKASDLPLSILIVGVGDADFKEMVILDNDHGNRLECSTGRIATRDIVQFVPMREVHGGEMSILQALLQELPGQFLTYMRSRDMMPHSVDNVLISGGVYPPATM